MSRLPGALDQPPFLNAGCAINTPLSPFVLLSSLKEWEQKLGHVPSARWDPFLIALDILLLGDQIIDAPELIVPHPRLHERAFALVPLAKLASTLVHPLLQTPLSKLASPIVTQDLISIMTSW